jgi:hypothetical protein
MTEATSVPPVASVDGEELQPAHKSAPLTIVSSSD